MRVIKYLLINIILLNQYNKGYFSDVVSLLSVIEYILGIMCTSQFDVIFMLYRVDTLLSIEWIHFSL